MFEPSRSRRARLRVFGLTQLPLLSGTIFISIEGALALPHVLTSPPAIIGVALIVVASIILIALPWETWPMWAPIPLAIVDVVGVAHLRLAYFNDLPSVGILTVFPVIWLAYAFRRWAIALAVLGALYITALPAIVNQTFPRTALEVASIITLPAIGLSERFGLQRQAARVIRQLRAAGQGEGAIVAGVDVGVGSVVQPPL